MSIYPISQPNPLGRLFRFQTGKTTLNMTESDLNRGSRMGSISRKSEIAVQENENFSLFD